MILYSFQGNLLSFGKDKSILYEFTNRFDAVNNPSGF